MEITEKADNMDFTGYDPVKLLMAEGTERLSAPVILSCTVFCTVGLKDSTLKMVNEGLKLKIEKNLIINKVNHLKGL